MVTVIFMFIILFKVLLNFHDDITEVSLSQQTHNIFITFFNGRIISFRLVLFWDYFSLSFIVVNIGVDRVGMEIYGSPHRIFAKGMAFVGLIIPHCCE